MLEEMEFEVRPNREDTFNYRSWAGERKCNHVRNSQLCDDSDFTENMVHQGNERKSI